MAEAVHVTDIYGQGGGALWSHRRSALSAQLLVAYATERGLSPGESLVGSGISAGVLAEPDSEIAGWQELRIARNLVAGLGDEPGLGVRVGLRYHLPVYGAFGLALMCSATVRDALALGLRLRALAYGFCRPVADPAAGTVTLVADRLPAPVTRFLVERDLAAWYALIREIVPAVRPVTRVELGFGDPVVYRQLLGVEVECGAGRHAVTVRDGVLGLPLPHADDTVRARYERQCHELVARRTTRTASGQVLAVLRARRGAIPSLAEVSGELMVSARTLRRRLTAEGVSFRELSWTARQERAEQLLTSTDLTVERVAASVGYSEAATFVRAFSRRHGVSPTAYRRTRAGVLGGRHWF
ncbi:MAG: AraC family transcriptional regulator ligand-binding domain-containing protein [Micromonosporaceae bacterium]